MIRLSAPIPLSSQQFVSLSHSFCVSLVALTGGRVGEGGVRGEGEEQIIRPQESLVLFKSFTTLCIRS
jgi:hypothetical protein